MCMKAIALGLWPLGDWLFWHRLHYDYDIASQALLFSAYKTGSGYMVDIISHYVMMVRLSYRGSLVPRLPELYAREGSLIRKITCVKSNVTNVAVVGSSRDNDDV